MKNIIKRIKSELKAEGKALRELKYKLKNTQRTGGPTWKYQSRLWDQKRGFRHRHIAYCELRGTPRHMIEQPADDNKPDEKRISRIKDEWYSEVEDIMSVFEDE